MLVVVDSKTLYESTKVGPQGRYSSYSIIGIVGAHVFELLELILQSNFLG